MRFLSKADLGALDTQHIFLHLSGAASRIPEEPWEFSMRCCEKNATIQKILMAEHLVEDCLLQVFFVPAERPQHNSQGGEITQTGQSFWMGFHSSFLGFFLNSLPSSFCPEVKVESFLRQRMPWPLSTWTNTLSTKPGDFFSLILGNSIVQKPYLISWCTPTAEPSWGSCFSLAFNEGWAQFPNTCDKPHVKTCSW